MMDGNLLFYGDNLDVLRQHVKDEAVDLVYLDPPFNSNADYNVLFAEQDGTRAAAQIKAFKDTWRWDKASAMAFQEIVETGPSRVAQTMRAFDTLLGGSNMLAYLSMMAPRLVELHRVLKPTGSIYLHCDSTASHYLKLLLDGVFGVKNFKNEVIWKRSDAHSDHKQGAKHYGRVHDVLLFYTKGEESTINMDFLPLPEKTVRRWYCNVEPETKRLFNMADLSGPGGAAKGNPHYEWKGITRYWRYNKEKMDELFAAGRIVFRGSGMPYLKRYLDESKGVPVSDLWDDIPMVRGIRGNNERLGYPTQKPELLLERIIKTSSNGGDTVLDPFCGCGTTIAVAQRLNRKWVGIDVTHLAITLIKSRLFDAYGQSVVKTYKVIGEPTTLPDARELAQDKDRYQFQYWALGLVGARPLQVDQKKGADKGVDGRLYFHDDAETGKTKQVIFSVKSGKLKADDVRAMSHVLDREKAEIGVLLSMEDPTQKMRTDAASVGFYKSPWGSSHPRLQIVTVAELLDGKKLDIPQTFDIRTFKKAPKAKKLPKDKDQFLKFDEDEGE